jgi:signal transduction histidine kinase
MSDVLPISSSRLNSAFLDYERPIRLRYLKFACLMALIFMPLGFSLDYFVYGGRYPGAIWSFLWLRLLCSVLLGFVWLVLHFRPGRLAYRYYGLLVALLPQLAIAWMIYCADGAQSPYYAGLNLVMLGTTILARWMLVDMAIIVVATLAFYLAACLAHGPIGDRGILFNNLYFLLTTGLFTSLGTWFYNRLRFQEFALRHELSEKKQELEAANAKLREADESKSRFFANISHELRTPLTLLIAPLETLRHRGEDLAAVERRELLGIMHGNALRLLKLINDLLDLVRLEAGRGEARREPVGLEAWARGLAGSLRHAAEEKRLTLETVVAPGLGAVLADRDQLDKICLNLLFNALKFTPAGGRVELGVAREDGHLRLRVRDTGVGIAPEHLPRIFDRFWQADASARRQFQGTGLGLALVKELAEAQGGTVEAASTPGAGTVMTVRLPFLPAPAGARERTPPEPERLAKLSRSAEHFPGAPADEAGPVRPAPLPPPPVAPADGKPRLLLADDEPDMRRFLRSQLDGQFAVCEATDGAQAVELAEQQAPDLILCDLMMPGKDGLQVCRELRASPATRGIPLVLLTAWADEATKLAGLAAGASDFLTKPFSTTELTVRLQNLLALHRHQGEVARQKQQLEAALAQLRETETLLVRREKLAVVGQLSAGLIHEINNPLNYARQALQWLRRAGEKLPADTQADFAETLGDAEEGVNRVVQLVSDLRGFTRQGGPERRELFELRGTVQAAGRFFAHERKEGGLHLEAAIPAGLWLEGERNAFIQVLVNLLQNAMDAVRTRKSFPAGEIPSIRLAAGWEAGRVVLRVRDNGAGIAPEHLDRIFEPFFTTKDAGKGTGLGLAIIHRIVTEHDGRIQVHSERDKFTEFTLDFPAAARAGPAASTNSTT